jgi:hypothetical protein
MPMGKRKIVLWDEQEAYTGWRKYSGWLQRPGVVKAIKRRTHKRERKEARAEIRGQHG